MPTLRTRAFCALLPTADPTPRAPEQTHHARLRAHDARVLASEVEPARVRLALDSALIAVTAELGCIVCGRRLPVETVARSLLPVHLWAACGLTVDALLAMQVSQ
jgi:hypothetical protein